MKHFGDITKISGYDVPIVDVITGGSPCQDLSVAGKRAGLAGERSGLFMEQIRIIKEMRDRDVRENGRSGFLIRPRYMVWENVPGAFTSGNPKGADFAAVIEEIIKVCEPDSNMCVCVPDGGWTKSGCFYSSDGRWSIAWRVHDSQFWGVPQRRKRISLVADFGGRSAPEILFERKGLSRDSESCGTEREKTPGAIRESIDCTSFYDAYQHHGWRKSDTSGTLTALQNNMVRGDTPLVMGTINHVDVVTSSGADVADTLDASYYKGTGSRNGKERTVFCIGNGQVDQAKLSEMVGALNCMHDQQAVLTTATVRRLTPLECERLQGFPDGWTDIGEWVDSNGKKHKDADSPRYKALGNSIALPFWKWLARRICAQYERQATMASLFDGIGGFPLAFQAAGAIPVWASEIEEFPIAVTKKHFPDKEDT